ncbi:DUF1831 domain-containing protein [Latilactobacillus graminis]|uniref:Amino acid metabolism n=2 Tax=Latilactobacillus graminis TaxID=60519 RepID=A0AA89L0X8_9LACO|nr:DUF1831 domain-containing protein [Latilactobacillus graminis]KRM23867.1 hypothetical protein FC90_GL001387 [Latilactobacillus graminis DSM 20719]QFP79756.1 DUF1831 domain-containing protein [Latilactobacillus graminis]
MALLKTTATILGSTVLYRLNPAVKKYTLRDVGFVPTNNGNFQMERPLDPNSPFNNAIKLKITIAKDLQTLKMSVTSPDGLHPVDIFKSEKNAENVEQFDFVINNLVAREVLLKEE